ncbi:hypothetical protein D3C80_1489050 [compost metagenome]
MQRTAGTAGETARPEDFQQLIGDGECQAELQVQRAQAVEQFCGHRAFLRHPVEQCQQQYSIEADQGQAAIEERRQAGDIVEKGQQQAQHAERDRRSQQDAAVAKSIDPDKHEQQQRASLQQPGRMGESQHDDEQYRAGEQQAEPVAQKECVQQGFFPVRLRIRTASAPKRSPSPRSPA